MQNLFTSLKKIPLYLDDISHSLEKRKQGDTKIITLTATLSPFDVKHAAEFDADQMLRRTLFKLNTPEPHQHFTSVGFRVPFPRQRMTIFTTVDTVKPSILIDHVRVAGIRVRVEKKSNLYSLILKLSFGPAGKLELEFVENWRTQTKAVTFEEAEKSLDFEDGDSAESDEEGEEASAGTRPTPMFDDARDDKPATEQRAIETAAAAPPADEPEKARRIPRRNANERKVH